VPGVSSTPASDASGSADVLLLRHAHTSWSHWGRRQGWADLPLTAEGRRAARRWASSIDVEFAAVVASDLQRAQQTAQIIARELRARGVVTLVGLREQNQGAWTGLTKDQIKRRWPDRLRERPRRPVGGEPPELVLERVLATLGSVAAAHRGRSVLAIAHSDVIRTLELSLGVDAPPVPHLEGRWLRIMAAPGRDVEQGVRSVDPGELTAGRLHSEQDAGALVLSGREG
jgi:broad specificity phosphatase PhoE